MLNESVKAKLVDDIEQVLTDNEQEYKSAEIIALVNRWYAAKEPLINLLRKHPNWNENAFAVVFDCDSVRSTDENKIYNKLREKYIYFPNYDPYRYDATFNWVYDFAKHTMVVDYQIERAGNYIQTEHPLHVGKTTRVLNKIFTDPNWDFPTKMGTYVDNNGKERNEYDRWFAELSDLINPMKVTRHTLLSVHPCDYLNMSHGTGWASCHNIYDGEYMAGTLSYMCDETSMIFYTVRAEYDGDCYWNEEKINRQVYCYSGTTMLQSRLYPRYNDYENIEIFRNAVQNILAVCLGVPNRWILKKGVNTSITRTNGLQYPDYNYSDFNTNICVLRDEEPNEIEIGSAAYCIECGSRLRDNDYLNCCSGGGYTCECCGNRIHYDEVRWVGDTPYCDECAIWCDHCNQYEYYENIHEYHVDGVWMWICDDCIDRHYSLCESCNEYFLNSEMNTDGRIDLCKNCLENYYYVCAECREFVYRDDACMGLDDEYRCQYCHEQKYKTCHDCGCIVDTDQEGEYIPGKGYYLCDYCYESYVDSNDDEIEMRDAGC